MSYAHLGFEPPRDRRYIWQGFHRRSGEICGEENISERYVVVHVRWCFHNYSRIRPEPLPLGG